MNQSKWTPGPWVAKNSCVSDSSGNVVSCCVLGSVYRDDDAEDHATANLIAAAPELYEALDVLMGATGPGDAEQVLAEERESIMDLLAKARGES